MRISDSISFAISSSVIGFTPAGGFPSSNGAERWKSDCTHWSPQGIVQSNPIFETVAGGSLLAIIGSTVIVFIDGMITVSRIGSNLKAIADLIWLSSQM